MIKIVEGNILDCGEDVIGHQVNCLGVMGGGLAKQIKEKYPYVYKYYKEFCFPYIYSSSGTDTLLGECCIVSCDDDKYIANLFGQNKISRFRRMTDYKALEKSLVSLKDFSKSNNLSVALPYNLGCGLAGGNWSKVYEIIEKVFEDYKVTLYKYNK